VALVLRGLFPFFLDRFLAGFFAAFFLGLFLGRLFLRGVSWLVSFCGFFLGEPSLGRRFSGGPAPSWEPAAELEFPSGSIPIPDDPPYTGFFSSSSSS